MITTTTAFSMRLQEDSRTFKARFLKDDSILDVGVKKITVNKGACGETFSVGSVYSSYIEVTLDECDEALENKELQLQIGLVLDDGSVEYLTMGYYTVTEVSRTAYQMTFIAVGRISSKLNCLPDSLPIEQTLADLAAAITETTGIPVICRGVTLAGTIEEDLTGLTCKEILEVITVVLGGFATENGSGGIVISRFSTDSTIGCNGERTITEPQFADYDYNLTGVKVVKTEEWEDEDGTVHPEVSFSQGTPRQNLSMKYMTESLFPAFAENTVGFTYRPATVPLALGDPRLEPWDTIEFTDVKGNVYSVPCMSIVHSFDGGLSTTVSAPGESESESETQSKGPLVQQLERVAMQLFTAEQAIVKRLTADAADIRYAEIDFSNINQAAVKKLFSDSGIIKDIVVREGRITGELVGVTIKGDIIEGATVVADKLVIKGDNGLYYKLNTDGASLEAEQTEYNSLDGKIITAKSVTASKIAVDDLVAFGATIGGFNITEDSLYSGIKTFVDSPSGGIYLDKDGQVAFGDDSNHVKCFLDEDGSWKLEISTVKDMQEDVKRLNAFMATAEGFDFTFDTENCKKELERLGGEITTQKSYIRLVNGEIVIGQTGENASPVTAVYTNTGMDIRYNGVTVATYTNDIMQVKNTAVENQAAYWGQWAVRKGSYVNGKGYNMDFVWIGG